jgi:threonine dehydratase
MWPWESPPSSAAEGILDDETYDWLGVVEGLAATDGSAVVVPEPCVVAAHRLATEVTGIGVSPTGTAGLAGLIAARAEVGDDERVIVIFSGAV